MLDRYARQVNIDGWNQPRLQDARVIVVGMGALGSEVSRLLAMTGVGALILCDFDRIETSNLSRGILFRPGDEGSLKVDVAARRLREMAPELTVATRPKPLLHALGLAELRDASLVMSCLDSRSARLSLAGRCMMVGAPLIDGATDAWGGEVRPFVDLDGPCYGCGLGSEGRATADQPWSCVDVAAPGEAPSTAATSALIASWMVLHAVRFLMGLPVPGSITQVDGGAGTAAQVVVQRDPTCPLHTRIGKTRRLAITLDATVGELRATLDTAAVALAWAPIVTDAGTDAIVPWRPATPVAAEQLAAGVRTTLELTAAPGHCRLSDLGVAPREILLVRDGEEYRWVELMDCEGDRVDDR